MMINETQWYEIQSNLNGEWTTVGVETTLECAREFVRKFPRLNIAKFEHRILKCFKRKEVVE